MPRHPKYPLEPLREHREREVDDATAELGAAVHAREQAEEEKARAEARSREASERAAVVRAAEAEHLDRGELRAVDLARQGAWEVGVEAEKRRLDADVRTSADTASQKEREEVEARSELARKKADRDVVAKDEARFVERVRRAAEAREEEQAEEAYRGGRAPRGRSEQ